VGKKDLEEIILVEGRGETLGSRKFIECVCIKLKICKSEKNET
jgi:hypothetical protein